MKITRIPRITRTGKKIKKMDEVLVAKILFGLNLDKCAKKWFCLEVLCFIRAFSLKSVYRFCNFIGGDDIVYVYGFCHRFDRPLPTLTCHQNLAKKIGLKKK